MTLTLLAFAAARRSERLRRARQTPAPSSSSSSSSGHRTASTPIGLVVVVVVGCLVVVGLVVLIVVVVALPASPVLARFDAPRLRLPLPFASSTSSSDAAQPSVALCQLYAVARSPCFSFALLPHFGSLQHTQLTTDPYQPDSFTPPRQAYTSPNTPFDPAV